MTTTATKQKTIARKAPLKKKEVAAVNLTASIYNQKAASAGTIALPEKVFGLSWNADLVHQVVVGMQANKRAGTAHTKDRSEVSGGGKKPWKQKGTGRARHGSNRSPIWTGGGVTFGPRNDKDYSQKINKKMRVKALFTVLSQKYADSSILFIDSMSFGGMKTKDANATLATLAGIKGFEKLGSKKPTTMLLVLPEPNDVIEKSFANLSGVTVVTVNGLNPLVAMPFHNVVVVDPATVVPMLEAKLK
ncbi:MAG: ribosomal protein large subunit ribosomal protein [Candidatus Nomurabacteria bacterium]|nr:ribosomal protein large subunit ribosomal protein [Candidatus Nomurabacteria bacterium]